MADDWLTSEVVQFRKRKRKRIERSDCELKAMTLRKSWSTDNRNEVHEWKSCCTSVDRNTLPIG